MTLRLHALVSRLIPLALALCLPATVALAGPPSDAGCMPDNPVAPDPPGGTDELTNEQTDAWDQWLLLVKDWDGSDMEANEILNRLQQHYNTYYAGSTDSLTQNYGAWFEWQLELAMNDFERFKQKLMLKQQNLCRLRFPVGSCHWINGGVVFQVDPESDDEWLDELVESRIMIGLQEHRILGTYVGIGTGVGMAAQLEREMHCLPSPPVKPRFEVRISHEDCQNGCVRSWIHIFDRKEGALVQQYYIDHCPPIPGGVEQDERWEEVEDVGEGFAEALEKEISSYLKGLGEKPTRKPTRARSGR